MAPTVYGSSLFNTATATTVVVNGGSGSGDDSDIPASAGAGAGSRVRIAGSGRRPATHGSRTLILDLTETVEEDTHHGILDLAGEPQDGAEGRRVQWDDDVIDNEHMNKKKSKICCIFKKQREFGESSDESSSDSDSSGSESDGGPVSFGGHQGNNKGKDKRDAADGDDKDGACEHAGDPNHHHHHHKPKKTKKKTVNAYEWAPKVSSTPKPINTPNESN